MPSEKEWSKFFQGAGIPSKVSGHYAKLFVENRMQTTMLSELDKEHLKDMGIVAIGDIIAILKYAKRHCGDEGEEEGSNKSGEEETTLTAVKPGSIRDRPIPGATVGGDVSKRKIFWMLRVATRRKGLRAATLSNQKILPSVIIKRKKVPSDTTSADTGNGAKDFNSAKASGEPVILESKALKKQRLLSNGSSGGGKGQSSSVGVTSVSLTSGRGLGAANAATATKKAVATGFAKSFSKAKSETANVLSRLGPSVNKKPTGGVLPSGTVYEPLTIEFQVSDNEEDPNPPSKPERPTSSRSSQGLFKSSGTGPKFAPKSCGPSRFSMSAISSSSSIKNRLLDVDSEGEDEVTSTTPDATLVSDRLVAQSSAKQRIGQKSGTVLARLGPKGDRANFTAKSTKAVSTKSVKERLGGITMTKGATSSPRAKSLSSLPDFPVVKPISKSSVFSRLGK